MIIVSEQEGDSTRSSGHEQSKTSPGPKARSASTTASSMDREAAIDAAENDFLVPVQKYCTTCRGNKCGECGQTGYEVARQASQLGGLSYSMGYGASDIYRKFAAQYEGNANYEEGHQAVVDALEGLQHQPCPVCQGKGEVAYLLSPVQGGNEAVRQCPACKGAKSMESTSHASRDMHKAPFKSMYKSTEDVLVGYEKLRLAKSEDPKAPT